MAIFLDRYINKTSCFYYATIYKHGRTAGRSGYPDHQETISRHKNHGGGGVLIKDLKKGMLCTLESEKSVSEDLLIEPKEISSRESQKNHQKGKYMKISKKRISTSLLSCLKRILLPPVCKKMIDYKYRKLVDRPAGSKSSKLK